MRLITLLIALLLSSFVFAGTKYTIPTIPILGVIDKVDTTQLPAFNSPITLNGSGSSDPDGQIVAYQWVQVGTTPMLVVIQNAQNSIATAIPPAGKVWVAGVYTFELTVQDNNGATAKSQTHVTISNNPHLPPVVLATSDAVIQAPANSTSLSVQVTTTDGATATAYLWTMISGPTQATFSAPNSNSTTIGNLAVGIYQVRIKVTDSKGASAADTTQITVKAANTLPVSNTGADQIIVLPVKTVVIGGIDKPADVAIQWEKTAGPTNYNIVSPHSMFTQVSNLQQGTYTFKKTVTIAETGAFATDFVNVKVRKKTIWEIIFGWV